MSERYEMKGVYEIGEDGIIKHGDTFCRGYAADDIIREFGTEIKEPVTYKAGDRFSLNMTDREYILAVTGIEWDSPTKNTFKASMINLKTGDFFRYGWDVVNPHRISECELDSICGGMPNEFTKIEEEE